MTALIITLHVLTCLALILIVLLQHGKGADIGSAFGAGASQTVFGSRGAGNFLTKLTTGSAVVFMLTSLTLSYFSGRTSVLDDIEEQVPVEAVEEVPVEIPESSFPEATPIPGEATPPGSEAQESEVPSGFEEIPLPGTEPEPAPAPEGSDPS